MHVGIANPRWRGKRSRHSRRMRNPQFYVSGKRPIPLYIRHCHYVSKLLQKGITPNHLIRVSGIFWNSRSQFDAWKLNMVILPFTIFCIWQLIRNLFLFFLQSVHTKAYIDVKRSLYHRAYECKYVGRKSKDFVYGTWLYLVLRIKKTISGWNHVRGIIRVTFGLCIKCIKTMIKTKHQ